MQQISLSPMRLQAVCIESSYTGGERENIVKGVEGRELTSPLFH